MLVNLKRLREERHISQKLLAESIGVTQQSINKYENHNIEPDIQTLVRIANFFDTSVDYLIGNTVVRWKIDVLTIPGLSVDEEKLLTGYRKLTRKQKDSIITVIENYCE